MPHIPMPEVDCGVTRMIDGTVRLDTQDGNYQMTPKQARKLASLLSEAAVEPPTLKEVAIGVLSMVCVLALIAGFIAVAAPK